MTLRAMILEPRLKALMVLFFSLACLCVSKHAGAHDEVKRERIRFFMPAIEGGVVWHGDPAFAPGAMFRTSLDYRFERINAPFLRIAYDATTSMYRSQSGAQKLVATTAFHDIVLGGGQRWGTETWQITGSALYGIQIATLPTLVNEANQTSLLTRSDVAGLGIITAGFEYYFDEDLVLTTEIMGRIRSAPLTPGGSLFSGAWTFGLATAL